MQNVLVTAVGSTTAISVIKGLRQQTEFDVQIHGVDIYRENEIAGSHFCNTFTQVPLSTSSDYIKTVFEICRTRSVGLLIPIVDEEVASLSEHHELFRTIHCQIATSDAETVSICRNKIRCMMTLKDAGVDVPKTMRAENVQDIKFPVFVKPNMGRSSINAVRVDDDQQFQAMRNRVPDLIVQDFIDGHEYTVDVLCDFEANPVAIVPRRRIETRSGISYKGMTCHVDRLTEIGLRICRALRLMGPANFQCIQSGDDFYCIEVNPRFSGGLPLTTASGINGPLWLMKFVNGASAPGTLLPFEEKTMARYWEEVFR